MKITYTLRKLLINITGYWIYKKKYLPLGVDLKEDLLNKFQINPRCIFDIGANYGQTALYYHKAFKHAKVFSFEPVKNSFDTLVKNTRRYKNISCYNFAFGDEKKEIEIYLHEERFSACNSLKFDNRDGDNASKEIVKVITLNDFVKEHKIEHIDLLKIDTEGYELEVLKGGENILSQGSVSAIIGEVALSVKNNRNTQLHALISYLDKFDYYFVGLYDTDIRTYRQGIAFSNALFMKK